ncbi:hypothetical protein [Maioricimonas sp. JC845]|uniref:hypothetical protein n=1 Tax=Maioricimonas sp. JC845 TaxID=3232138 RepID=UPI00345846DE
MTALAPIRLLIVLLAGLVVALPATTADAQTDPYTPIPPGFDFPTPAATLEHFRQTENVSQLRRHAWWLWAGINQEAAGGGPVWETWYPANYAFRPEDSVETPDTPLRQLRFEQPRQFQPQPGQPQLEAVGQAALSFVLFNQEALDHTRDEKLYLRSTLNTINNGFPAGTPLPDRKIPDYPPESVVLKLVWQVVKQNGLTEQPIWDFEPTKPFDEQNGPETWKRKVLVDPSRLHVPDGEMNNGMHVVSLQRFYHVELDTPELVNSAPGAVLGDYAVLVCMHVTTREIEDWVWATFWWHDRPNSGPLATDRIDTVTGVWRNYLMDVAYDTVTPREFDGTPNACMNPWLEARFRSGLGSNCMTCHQRSTWPQESFLPVTRGGLAPDDPYFENRTRLDFLWSIGDRARP